MTTPFNLSEILSKIKDPETLQKVLNVLAVLTSPQSLTILDQVVQIAKQVCLKDISFQLSPKYVATISTETNSETNKLTFTFHLSEV